MNCVEINCPYIPYCRYYPKPEPFMNNCLHADQIAIRTKYYYQQVLQRNKEWYENVKKDLEEK